MVELLAENNRLLRNLKQAEVDVSYSKESQDDFEDKKAALPKEVVEAFWAEEWKGIINDAFADSDTAQEIRKKIDATIQKKGLSKCLVTFDEVGAYQQNHAHAVFMENAYGCCLLIPSPDNEQVFAAFPYPVSGSWYSKGVSIIAALYQIQGLKEYDAPKIRIKRVAFVKTDTRINNQGDALYSSLKTGELQASM